MIASSPLKNNLFTNKKEPDHVMIQALFLIFIAD